MYDALASSQRRVVVRYLAANGGAVSVFDIATHVAADTEMAWSTDVIESVSVGLNHVHLPKLVAAGLVEWDDDVVSSTPLLTRIPLETLTPAGPGVTPDKDPGRRSGVS